MVVKAESAIGAKGAIQTMKRKQKTTAEVQAAIFRREHRKSPLRGGVKLTLKKARELALQEFGTAKGIQLPDGIRRRRVLGLELEKSIQQLSERSYQTMSKQKQDKQGGGWQFPRPLEIIKCKEGNKEYMKERPARKPYGRIVKVCEFSLEAVAEFGDDDARAVWRLAKRAARDFLRVSWINTAIVTAAKTDRPYMAVIVYGKY